MDVQGDDEMNVQNDGDYENPQVQDPATDTPQSISPAPVQADQPSQVRYLRVAFSTYACITYKRIHQMVLVFFMPLSYSYTSSLSSHSPIHLPILLHRSHRVYGWKVTINQSHTDMERNLTSDTIYPCLQVVEDTLLLSTQSLSLQVC